MPVETPLEQHLINILTHWGRDKMNAIFQTTFSNMYLIELECMNSIKISLLFVSRGPINNIPALAQIMAWCRPGNKPLSEPMMVHWRTYASPRTHICVAPLAIKCFQIHVLVFKGVASNVLRNVFIGQYSVLAWFAVWYKTIVTVETLYSTIYYSKYFIELNFDKSTQYVALWTHKRHPIPRPFGRAMECLLWVLEHKLIVL